MLDERDLFAYARGVARALRVMGPTHRDEVLDILRRLNLCEQEAREALRFALARHILEEDDAMLSVPRDPPRLTPRGGDAR